MDITTQHSTWASSDAVTFFSFERSRESVYTVTSLAFLAQTDYEIGRLLKGVRDDGHNEDTAIFYIVGDNGASAEGGPPLEDTNSFVALSWSHERRTKRAAEA